MPTYAYSCTECGHAFDAVQAFTDDALTVCPECGGRLRKVYGSIGVSFKGSGFYRNDSRASAGGKDGGAKESGSADGGSKESGSKESSSGKDSGSKDSGSKGSGSGAKESKPAASAASGSSGSSGSSSGTSSKS